MLVGRDVRPCITYLDYTAFRSTIHPFKRSKMMYIAGIHVDRRSIALCLRLHALGLECGASFVDKLTVT